MYSKDYNDLTSTRYSDDVKISTNISFMNKVYGWMSIGLLITAIVSVFTAQYCQANATILKGPAWIICVIAQFGLVFVLSAHVQKLSSFIASLLFILYSALTGITFSFIFLVYNLGSIMMAFYSATAVFGVMAFYGTITKKDLTGIGSLCKMGLWGLIIAQLGLFITSLFVKNIHWQSVDLIISAVGVIIFVGLTAYDAQKIKALNETGETRTNIAILGALILYLDFINLFLFLLRLFGGSRK